MSAVINTNLASLLAQNSLNNAQGALATSVQRLSSGLRINSAKDDASGLAIVQTMAGHIKSLDQANLNGQQAINLAQTADTSLGTTQDILLRMQQLAVEGSNGSLSGTQRQAIVTELKNLNTQINSFSAGTTYNGIQLLGSASTVTTASSIQNGSVVGSSASITNLSVSGAAAGTITFSANGAVLSAYNGTTTQAVTLTDLSAGQSEAVSFSNLGVSFTIQASATETAGQLASGIQTDATLKIQSGTVSSLAFQIGASPTASGDTISIATYNISTATGGQFGSMTSVGTDIATTLNALTSSSTDTQWTSAFQTLQGHTATALSDISTARATVGSIINQLGYIDQNLAAQSANEQSAKSTVSDTNYSAETSMLTKGQILQQAATAMLAQANQMPNVILSLLK